MEDEINDQKNECDYLKHERVANEKIENYYYKVS